MFTKKTLKLCLMFLLLIGVFHLLSKTNINFQKPENIEDFDCDKRFPDQIYTDKVSNVRENMWSKRKKR
jgi:hypothetical protein